MTKLIVFGAIIFLIYFIGKQIYLFGKASSKPIPKEPSTDPVERKKEKNALNEKIEAVKNEIERLSIALPRDIESAKERSNKLEHELEELNKIKEKYN